MIEQINNPVLQSALFGKMKNFTDRFTSEFSVQLSRVLAADTPVAFTRTAILEHNEFRRDFFAYANRYAFTCPKLSPAGAMWIGMDQEFCEMAVDCMLGVTPAKPALRKLTHIEQRLAGRIANLAAAIVAGFATAPGTISSTDITDQTIKPPAGTSVALFKYEVSIADFCWGVSLFVPAEMVDMNSAARRFGHAPLEISAHYSTAANLSPDDLRKLKPGNILTTDIPVGSDITIRLAGIDKFRGRLALVNKKRAVTITEKL